MNYLKRNSVLILFIIISLNWASLSATQSDSEEPYKILFIGSSYFQCNNLPDLFENLVKSFGDTVATDQKIRSGLYLQDHANSTTTEAKINAKQWDYVILQGVGSITAYPDYYTHHPVYPALSKLREKILNNCASTKIIFCLPWAYEDGMTWLEGWTDTYSDMQLKIYENTLSYCDELDLIIAPVGWAWNTVLKERNYPLHYLHMSDWNHPSLKGSYLMACVIFSTVYMKSSVDLNYFGGLRENVADYFREVASTMVLDSLELWNIVSHSSSNPAISIPAQYHLRQNFPNPFNPTTKIRYSIPWDNFVILRLYDILGKETHVLAEEFHRAGDYEIVLNAENLQSGLYIYSLQTKDFIDTRKCIVVK